MTDTWVKTIEIGFGDVVQAGAEMDYRRFVVTTVEPSINVGLVISDEEVQPLGTLNWPVDVVDTWPVEKLFMGISNWRMNMGLPFGEEEAQEAVERYIKQRQAGKKVLELVRDES